MIEAKEITGVILAGGRGRRMGGQDKGLVELDGEPLVGRILSDLAPQVGQILINANRNLLIQPPTTFLDSFFPLAYLP